MVNFNSGIPEELRQKIEAIMSKQNSLDQESLNQLLEAEKDSYNDKPQDFLKGYSPSMAYALRHAWNSPGSPIQFTNDLTLEQLSASRKFKEIRTLLLIMREQGRVEATSGGNFKRKFVESMVDTFLDAKEKEVVLSVNKVLNEPDVWPLHEARIVAEVSGLIQRRKGSYSVIKKYYPLLEESAAGTLFVRLFDSFYTKYNVGYQSNYPYLDWLQHEIKFVLYPLYLQAQKWLPIKGIAKKILHPIHHESLLEDLKDSHYVTDDYAMELYFLNPLEQWGLLEFRVKKERFHDIPTHVRITPLFKNFITFDTNPRQII